MQFEVYLRLVGSIDPSVPRVVSFHKADPDVVAYYNEAGYKKTVSDIRGNPTVWKRLDTSETVEVPKEVLRVLVQMRDYTERKKLYEKLQL